MIGEKIQTLRKMNNLTQEQLAEKINVSRQAVSKWELGESMPEISNITQLCVLFGVAADYLIMENEKNTVQKTEDIQEKNNNIFIHADLHNKEKNDVLRFIKRVLIVFAAIFIFGIIISLLLMLTANYGMKKINESNKILSENSQIIYQTEKKQ